ncbi:FAD-dependent oxidoreductase [Streptomyces montanisoli]|uniref:FAD-dependent oxidoreductase n=1 Tax=Streptomyces montanisoli TaxID=2798581 RepID=A0A940MEB4_9ACTN|nr:FAD-dependent oxidoreductase [Streptomyces montanisoli]MBP0461489.1 FAD-dependent oxidoreductase [Streptomyces montanisoli]
MTRAVLLPGRALPVLYETGTVVLGAGLAGASAAVALAAAGRRVLLVDEGASPGGELTEAGRPWLTVPRGAERAGLLGPLLAGHEAGRRPALRPAAVKLRVEEALAEAGVEVLYGTRVLAPRAGRGLVVVTASGRAFVRCESVLDARPAEPVEGEPAVWSVEFEGASADAVEASRHPAAAGLLLADGYLGTGHLYALASVRGGRRDALRRASHLLRAHPAFADARLGAVGVRPLAAAYATTDLVPGPVPGWWRLPPPPPLVRLDEPPLDPAAALAAGTAAAAFRRRHGAGGRAGPPGAGRAACRPSSPWSWRAPPAPSAGFLPAALAPSP